MWQGTLVIPALGRQRQGDQEFKIGLGLVSKQTKRTKLIRYR